MGSRHRPETALGPAGDLPCPLHAPACDPTPITQLKVRTRAKSRVSIETRELRLSSWECDFPGINIPITHCLLLCLRWPIGWLVATLCFQPVRPSLYAYILRPCIRACWWMYFQIGLLSNSLLLHLH